MKRFYLLHIEADGVVDHHLTEDLNDATRDSMVVRTWNGQGSWGPGVTSLSSLCPLCSRISIADAAQAILGVE